MKTERRVIWRAAVLITRCHFKSNFQFTLKARSVIYMCMENYLWLVKGEIRGDDGLRPPKAPGNLSITPEPE